MTAPVDVRLSGLSDAAIALALGVCVGRPQSAREAGLVSALVAELSRRGVLERLLWELDPALAEQIQTLAAVDRGQRWAQTGHR